MRTRRWIKRALVVALLVVPAGTGFEPAAAATGMTGRLVTVAGDGSAANENPAATATSLAHPHDAVRDRAGNTYIADTTSCVIRRVDRAGLVSTLVGAKGVCGYSPDSSSSAGSRVGSVRGLALNAGETELVFADAMHCVVRRVTLATGALKTLAGVAPTSGSANCGYNTSTNPLAALLKSPSDVAFSGTSIFIAEAEGCVLRRLTPSGSGYTISRVLGVGATDGTTANCQSGPAATPTVPLDTPGYKVGQLSSVAVDASGRVYVADRTLNIVRRVALSPSPGTVTTIAGTSNAAAGFADGAVGTGRLNYPHGLAVDNTGTNPSVYVADTLNCRIRKVTQAGTPTLSTIAGTGTCGFAGEAAPYGSAQLTWPMGTTLTAAGDLLVSDTFNNRVRLLFGVGAPKAGSVFEEASLTHQFRSFANGNGRTDDWVSGDGAFSLKLRAPDNRILWFMGDSYDGTVRPADNGREPIELWVTNNVLIQQPVGSATASTMASIGSMNAGAVFPRPTGCSFYWPHAAIQSGPATVQILMRCTDGEGAPTRVDLWQLQETGSSWTSTPLVTGFTKAFHPTASVCAEPIEFGQSMFHSKTETFPGTSVNYTESYVYGLDQCVEGVFGEVFVHTARVTNFGNWPDLRGDWWYVKPDGTETTAPSAATRLHRKIGSAPSAVLNHAGAEYSVTRQSATSYRMVLSEISLGDIRMYTSTTPHGPWTASSESASVVYSPPERTEKGHPVYNPANRPDFAGCQLVAYNAKEHPQFNEAGKVVISYNVKVHPRTKGSCDNLGEAEAAHVDNYRPRFITVTS